MTRRVLHRVDRSIRNHHRRTRPPSSGYRGIIFEAKRGSFRVRIRRDRCLVHGGNYKTLDEAIVAYNELATMLYGKFANLHKLAGGPDLAPPLPELGHEFLGLHQM